MDDGSGPGPITVVRVEPGPHGPHGTVCEVVPESGESKVIAEVDGEQGVLAAVRRHFLPLRAIWSLPEDRLSALAEG